MALTSAAVVKAELGEVRRFTSPERLCSYLGGSGPTDLSVRASDEDQRHSEGKQQTRPYHDVSSSTEVCTDRALRVEGVS
ncbi:MAG: hypothetical protein ACTSYL_05680 [Candidatus Thorarchaeota archaeon]